MNSGSHFVLVLYYFLSLGVLGRILCPATFFFPIEFVACARDMYGSSVKWSAASQRSFLAIVRTRHLDDE